MKKLVLTFMVFILAAAAIPLLPSRAYANQPPRAAVPASAEMRGLWVTSAYNLDWPSRQGLTPAQLRQEINEILTRAVAQGINAVFVQVRPVADALYNSEIFPWSHLITGTQGQAPAEGFDPLSYWVERGHAMGVEVHAWLNPYRVTFPNQRITDPNQLAPNHPARLNPSLVIAYNNGLFFDPGNPAARQLIADGVAELLRNYNLDGIHLDDYFYPSRNFPDQATFARYGSIFGAGLDIHEWRRESVNELIRLLQSTVREVNPNARFGVSPIAIWMNEETDPRGSATRGRESYHAQYADTRRWVLEGWIDYIVPQIYWYTGFAIADFEIVLSWWEDLVSGTDVDLYIGLAIYREVQGRANWSGEILRQLERTNRSEAVSGVIFFREAFMRSDVGNRVGQFFANNIPAGVSAPPVTPPPAATPMPPTVSVPIVPQPPQANAPTVIMDRLLVAQPARNREILDAANFFFYGSGVPGVPVYVNGQLITNRTEEGFFSIFLPLVRGENTFTFTQAGQPNITRVITNNAPAPPQPPAVMARAAVTNAFPAADEWARVGTTLTLRATAPAGATVTAQLGGQTIQMTQTNPNLTATPANIVAAQFTGQFALNTAAAEDAILDIGRPVYTATWNGQTVTATSAGIIRQLGINAPFFAEVTAESAWVFPQAGTAGGSNWMLVRGQRDRVAAITGNWTRLASGQWINSDNIRTWRDPELVPPPITGPFLGFMSEGRYIVGENADVIVWSAPFFPAVHAEFDGSELIVALGMQNVAPVIFYTPGATLFSEIRIGRHNGAPAYFMTLREDARLEGFYLEHVDGQLRLVLRRRRALAPGNYPFAGFTFIVDAGHGGTDPGALGAMGALLPESHIVLAQADLLSERLRMLGANVVRIRETDVFYTLQQRVAISREVRPDMFISLHTNSTAEVTNATNIRGFTVWHRNPNSRPAAQSFMDSMYNVNPATNRHRAPSQANLYVCRPMWTPSIILEASFTNNIHDFSWLINPRRMSDYVWAVVNALLVYYG